MKNPFGGGGQGNLLQQMKKMQEQLKVAQKELEKETVTASSGGGAVQVTMSGTQVCRSVEIKPELAISGDHEMLQRLILTSVNQALEQSRKLAAKKLGPLSGGLG